MYIILGPSVTFYAIIFLRQWRLVRLTPTLSCIASACEGSDRMALYAAFSGASSLLECIDQDARHMMTTPSLIELTDPKLPYVSKLEKHNALGQIEFQILSPHPSARDHRLLYIAETSGGRRIIVKFMRTYSIELHSFCVQHGHAPAILGFQQLPGGWLAVAMEYLVDSVHPSESPDLHALCATWVHQLEGLMLSFHSNGFVHGDLREPNILCSGKTVMLIDFDWGGKVGDACYPPACLAPELTEGRTGIDQFISKDDDRRVLGNTIEELKIKACM
jgi:serine/threonine protein kinase